MIINVSTTKEFIPEWNNNRASTNPISITHKAPTMALYNALVPRPSIKLTIDSDGKSSGGETEMTLDYTKTVKEMLLVISNLELNIDGRTVSICNAGDLLGGNTPCMLSGLVDELGAYFQMLLTTKSIDEKN
jgi:hypothetical protein